MSKTVINIRSDMYSPGLRARKLWQTLFRLVGADKWSNLDSFLCDLRLFEERLGGYEATFWWFYAHSGLTYLMEFDPHEPNCFKVTLEKDRIVIEEVSWVLD